MGRDVYGVDPRSSADGGSCRGPASSLCWAGVPSATNEKGSGSGSLWPGVCTAAAIKTENIDPGETTVSRTSAANVRTGRLWTSPHSRGGAHVEIHSSLASLRLLSACRIAEGKPNTKKPPLWGFFCSSNPSMKIIPAIDLKDGKCVRLRQGRFDSATVFNHDPVSQALQWEASGATRIHIVDLNGSTQGKPVNSASVEKIVKVVRVPIQLGGGIRDQRTIATYLDIGIDTVIIGTMAAKDPEKVSEFLTLFPGRISIGIDANNGVVAVEGWQESTQIKATDLAVRFDNAGPAAFIYTDIERDGMMKGPNIESTREFAKSLCSQVILSGGISQMADVIAALPLENDGVRGMIIGRALYDGRIDLREALELAEKNRNAR
jgi:phosphoribosylformimino-5-aminoimidazole carboxamide ribotide isomerase